MVCFNNSFILRSSCWHLIAISFMHLSGGRESSSRPQFHVALFFVFFCLTFFAVLIFTWTSLSFE